MRPGGMLRAAVAALLFAIPATALALRSGDNATELKAEFLANGPVAVTPAKIDETRRQYLKAVVFLRANAPGSGETLELLYELRLRYGSVTFIAVSPDPKEASLAMFRTMEAPNFVTALDKNMETTRQYMAASAVYPKAFVIDYRGRIIWDGEAVDLDEMLESYYSGGFDEKRQVKISPALEEMQSRMRTGEDRRAEYAMEQVLELDPANMAALRMRVFMLESTGRETEAWKLLERQYRQASKDRRIYLMMFDFASRSALYGAKVPEIAAYYLKNIPANGGGDSSMAWGLLTRRPFDPASLKTARQLVERALGTIKTPALSDANVYGCAALYESRIGRLDRALEFQRKATEVLRKFAPHRVAASLEMESFYQASRELAR